MSGSRWDNDARAKLARILGAAKADEVMTSTMLELGVASLTSPNDLYAFSRRLLERGGVVAAVGGLLSVHAAIHGATGAPAHSPSEE